MFKRCYPSGSEPMAACLLIIRLPAETTSTALETFVETTCISAHVDAIVIYNFMEHDVQNGSFAVVRIINYYIFMRLE